MVEEDTLKKAEKSLHDAISGYLEVVLDTDDKTSIPQLLMRRSPLKDIIEYHLLAILIKIKVSKFKARRIFKEAIPFHLSSSAHC